MFVILAVFSSTGKKVPALKSPRKIYFAGGIMHTKNVSSIQWQNDEIRNKTFRNKTMKLPLVHTDVAAKKRTENDRLKVYQLQ